MDNFKNIKLEVQYNGAKYYGWQKQKTHITVQEVLEKTLSKLLKEEIEVTGCSRTDSKVHALKYVCNFKSKTNIPCEKIKYALNPILPDDIVVLNSIEVDNMFHSRYSCIGKTYLYKILNREVRGVFGREGIYHYKDHLCLEKMKLASKYFIGTHDFNAFKSTGSSVKSTIRTIESISIIKNDQEIIIEVTGDGFLYNMVRIIVGTLIQVGINKIEPEYIQTILKSKDRKLAGPTAPAEGLYLKEIYF
ncbi:tRNA pseudouridine(38-40) synthase TruA [Oceanirhabdus sp. W0125-5]|uniref:tRNA pseudouridine(38-40) synthase TruA n=1 Tax=Oceanirhabdus sp. W0125-5 TaxID=2999116 RepID=UPI0022F33C95|nr:tRNA pseudouridine(38-40) synthase TruA [Oceanirhabdus sp. W0125-5]WBW98026.1 tRNA pseudouridine(38-40) synthase TruA [Oceanirhabdus sp. W0125-5]